jgi:hypothetical protein
MSNVMPEEIPEEIPEIMLNVMPLRFELLALVSGSMS